MKSDPPVAVSDTGFGFGGFAVGWTEVSAEQPGFKELLGELINRIQLNDQFRRRQPLKMRCHRSPTVRSDTDYFTLGFFLDCRRILF